MLSGHEGAVLNVHYNSSGTFALSCGKDRTVRLWSLGKAALLKTYDGHGHEVRDVACSTDNSKLASVGGDRQASAPAAPPPLPTLTPPPGLPLGRLHRPHAAQVQGPRERGERGAVRVRR